MRPPVPALLAATALAASVLVATVPSATAAPPTTAWRGGELAVDTADLLSRSDIVLQKAPWRADQAMPLGNGRVGAAVWSRDGFTAQLNRGDTFPDLPSAGHLSLPGLFDVPAATDYTGRLDVHDATLVQRGAGTTVRTWVRSDSDQLVVEVTGADPDREQEAVLRLWEGRSPTAVAKGDVAGLGETFTDERNGQRTGQLAAVTADARSVRATVVGEREVKVTFRPERDGSFRIVAGLPSWDGRTLAKDVTAAVKERGDGRRAHQRYWHDFWDAAAPMRLDSEDGSARYLEALRVQQLYMSNASMRADVPTSHGGVTNIFSAFRDDIHWSADAWWHFNLRQPVWANLGAGVAELNRPYLDLYLDRIEQMAAWTRASWSGARGICVPEFMYYDGTAAACSSTKGPDYVNRIVSTGAEVVHNIWLQSQHTGDTRLLKRAYPLFAGVAEFYLSILEPGEDGLLHLNHVNALEVQWDTTDPTPDVAGMRTVFPIIAQLAKAEGDRSLARRLDAAYARLPELPTTTRQGRTAIAWSATDEPSRNTQNPDLEAVWPWGVVGADDQLAQDTFSTRVYDQTREWASDAQWAARLERPDDVAALLTRGTREFQSFANGFSAHNRNWDQVRGAGFYDGWNAVVASTLQDALVRYEDGTIAVAGAVPATWDVTGAVHVPGGHRVSVETTGGAPTLVGVEAGRSGTVRIENPWPGQRVQVIDGDGTGKVRPLVDTSADVVQVAVKKGRSYVVQRASAPLSSFRAAELGGERATAVQKLGNRTYGVDSGTPQVLSDVVRVVLPDKLKPLVAAAPGAMAYVDRSYTITTLPDELAGSVLVRGLNDDGKVVADEYLRLAVEKPATVYVAFAANGESTWWPTWMQGDGWRRTGAVVGTTDRPMVVFAKDVQPGEVSLPGNSGVVGQGGSSYLTFVQAR